MTKRVLIITYYWPPAGGVAVQRVLKFTKYLRDFNWEPVIYTVSNGEFPEVDESLIAEVPPGVEVIKTKIWEPYSWYKRITGKSQKEGIRRTNVKLGKDVSILESISVWVRGNLFIPDTRCFWIKPSVSFLIKKLKQEKIHAVISTGPPHSNHLIAYNLAKKTGIPWLADFRDPWTTMDYYKDFKLTRFADKKHHSLESKILLSASAVIVVGSFMREEFESKGAKRVELITNGFDASDFADGPQTLDADFTLVHVGSFFKRRNPDALWKAITQLKKINHPLLQHLKVKLIGRIDPFVLASIEQNDIGEFFEQIPFIPHNEVINFLNSAQILLLPIDNFEGSRWVLTGKLFEYMASKRPVLCIGPTDGDAAMIIKETGIGETFAFDDQNGLFNYLIKRHDLYLVNELEREKNADVTKYSRHELTRKLAQLLDEISV
jgi:glycosyltransferase involved in cell wall biosynthesis